MGDSACLMQPFSYTSGIPNEANEGNPIHALVQSISFGRFMSESLAWEKWSTFSHNRYVEEAERYSRPGSVAQKKAFFEAHYKKIAAQKAAAMLEQANAASNNETAEEEVANNINPPDSEIVIPNSNEVIDQQHVVATPNTAAYSFVNDNEYGSNAEKGQFESRIVDGADLVPENHVFVVNSLEVEKSNQLRDVDNHKLAETELGGTPQMEKPLLRSSNSNQDSLASMSKKKPSLSSSSSLIHGRATKVPSSPAKDVDPIGPKKDNNATPMIMKSAIHSADKKRSTPKSHYKSVNFTPIREINRFTSKVIRKIESSRPGASSSKTFKDCLTPLKTPTTVSKNEVRRHPSATPWSAERRARTPLDPSAPESIKVSQKWRLLPTENKMQTPILSTPFSFRTEERAARRKKICISLPFLPCCFQKLEDKFNANDAQKVQLQTKIMEKAETEIRKLRQSLCFKARPLPSFYKERKEQQNEMNKIPLAHPESPKLGRKPTRIMAESTSSLPPQRPSIKRSGSKPLHGKDYQTTPTRSLTPQSIVDTHENTSPNIQMDSHIHKYRT
ncbi:protein WVD2-like 7 isoform X2 [Juglans microcarpa x Juglans regia]|uniref:protein WVD2-like 7 isoform X2 n=1 Tax=Juglans microcarpa x Juglans regia TaxID=2249226 RepID=UPI001B7D9852|nr:protein WVD2-like 7 isoform X2 [Juglans microcarpa x Juglans regia]